MITCLSRQEMGPRVLRRNLYFCDHDMMRDGHEQEAAALAVVAFGADVFAEVAFDHAEDRLDLPALAVGFSVK